MAASFPEEEEKATPKTLASVFTYGNYSIKFSPLNTRQDGFWFGSLH
jgi:hypothetical protein